jgi:hypothetical protein
VVRNPRAGLKQEALIQLLPDIGPLAAPAQTRAERGREARREMKSHPKRAVLLARVQSVLYQQGIRGDYGAPKGGI